MKNIPFIILIMFAPGLFAQGVYNNGAKITIGAGTHLNIDGAGGNYRNETNVTDAGIVLDGTLEISGNYTNNVSAADIINASGVSAGVVFKGTIIQTVGGTTATPFTFNNLTINNPGGVSFAKSATVNGTLTLTSGLADIGSNDMILGSGASVAGSPSATSMIIATGTGQVKKQFITTGNFTFPVGDNNVTAKYSPVTLNFTGGTFAPGAYAGVNLVNAAYPDPFISGSYLNRYWNVTQNGITAFTCNAAFDYLPGDVTGTEGDIYCIRINPLPVSTFDLTNTATHQLTANGLTSFGVFTGGPGLKTLNLSNILLQGLYAGTGTMRQAWDAVGPHWATGIADHITIELHDAITYANTVFTGADIPLSTTGNATLTVPAALGSSYYITVKHRNSLETTTASAVSFAGSTINQSYGTLSNVFGSNLLASGDGYYLIYAGDVNQDGIIDTRDYIGVDNDSFNFASGYLATDVDGNGTVDTRDFIPIDNNNYNFIGTSHP